MSGAALNRISGYAPIMMSAVALLAFMNSLHRASHEDGSWHVWILMTLAQVPVIGYFAWTSRRDPRARRLLILQLTLWTVSLMAGHYQGAWS